MRLRLYSVANHMTYLNEATFIPLSTTTYESHWLTRTLFHITIGYNVPYSAKFWRGKTLVNQLF